ncbi:MAG: hypothetical protein AAGD13_24320 [Pseudomonadota bacterium]
MSTMTALLRTGQSLPDIQSAHWLMRAALAAMIAYQGLTKFPLAASDAASFDVPFILWIMAAVGEVAAGIALIAGGFGRTWIGDLVTRAGGAALAMIVASVLAVVYWAPPLDLFLGNQFHILLLVGGLYFALRGNKA